MKKKNLDLWNRELLRRAQFIGDRCAFRFDLIFVDKPQKSASVSNYQNDNLCDLRRTFHSIYYTALFFVLMRYGWNLVSDCWNSELLTILIWVLFLSTLTPLFNYHTMSLNGGNLPREECDDANPPSRTTELLAIELPMMGMALIVVLLRLISRYVVIKKPGWDDYLIIAATVFWDNLVLSSMS